MTVNHNYGAIIFILLLINISSIYYGFKIHVVIQTTGKDLKVKIISFFDGVDISSFANVEYEIDGIRKVGKVYMNHNPIYNDNMNCYTKNRNNVTENSSTRGAELDCIYYRDFFGNERLVLKQFSHSGFYYLVLFFCLADILFLWRLFS